MADKSPPRDLAGYPPPPPDFGQRQLPVVASQGTWYRLNAVEFAGAIYFDRSGRGRFDSPDFGWGILYVGEDIYAAFIECFGREHGAMGVSEATLRGRNLFAIRANRPLVFVDLTGSSLVKLGADARLSSGSYQVARQWAKAIWEHPQQVDGIRYRSRHDDGRICYGLFERAESSLDSTNLGNLPDGNPTLLAEILAHYDYGLL
jgi:hypothetical protein